MLILCWKHNGYQLYDQCVCVTFQKDVLFNAYVDICQRKRWWFIMYLNRGVQWAILVSSAINRKRIGLESKVSLTNNGHWPVADVSYLFYVLWFVMWYSQWTCICTSAKPLIKTAAGNAFRHLRNDPCWISQLLQSTTDTEPKSSLMLNH